MSTYIEPQIQSNRVNTFDDDRKLTRAVGVAVIGAVIGFAAYMAVDSGGGGANPFTATRAAQTASLARRGRRSGAGAPARFAWFHTAADAVGAAIEARDRLSRHRFPHETTIAVRMAIHAGPVIPYGEDLIGLSTRRSASPTKPAATSSVTPASSTSGYASCPTSTGRCTCT